MNKTIEMPETYYGGRIGDYFALLKPRVMSLVVFSGFAGLYLAPGHVHPFLGAIAILCIAMAAGASGAINMWYDRDIDVLMTRTSNRPIPKGDILPDEALAFGVTLALFSVILMGLALNWLAAFWLGFTIFFYVVIYTVWLKRKTPQNIVIGGAAGAFPPLIGWIAVTGQMNILPWIMVLLIFLWTPPHFWALALFRAEDYARAGIPMLPVVKGKENTKKQMFFYSILLLPVSVLPAYWGIGPLYYIPATLLSLGLIGLNIAVLKEGIGYRLAKKMFGYSIFYLFALFLLLILEKAIG